MAELSPNRRNRELTNLEMEAMTLVNEEILGPAVTDEEKYEELLEQRKERKAGEKLYDFLERQVGDQMRVALGQPLHNISQNILSRVISKNIQADLKKYKMGKRPQGAPLRDRTRSPASRRERTANNADDYGENFDQTNLGDLSKEVSRYLSALSTGANSKMSLIKMQVIKCDENSNNYKRMRQCFNHGDLDEADRLLAALEESNHHALLDLQNEISDGPNMVQTIGHLCEQLKQERLEQAAAPQRGRSPGSYQGGLRNRSQSGNRTRPGAASQGTDYARYDQQISELRRNLQSVEDENDKLRATMREMVDDYTRQLELRDETIKKLEQGMGGPPSTQPAGDHQLRQEVEDYKQENRILREKVNQLTREVEILSQNNGTRHQQLKDEVERLNRSLVDKDRYIERQITEQKNEWAEIYGNQKQTVEKLQREINMLSSENARLLKQLEAAEKRPPNFGGPLGAGGQTAGGPSAQELAETTKRLKKRELECQALWDTLKDMKVTGQNLFDSSTMLQILAKRALDTKAHRKLAMTQ